MNDKAIISLVLYIAFIYSIWNLPIINFLIAVILVGVIRFLDSDID